MKAEYEKIMASAVAAQLKKAAELGIKASWSTQHHLNALATAIAAQIPHDGKTDEESPYRAAILDVLTECYNVSAFQQMLAKKFAPTGHFQREAKKTATEAVDSFLALVEAAKGEPQAQG